MKWVMGVMGLTGLTVGIVRGEETGEGIPVTRVSERCPEV